MSEMVCMECATRQPVAGQSCAPLTLLLAGASWHGGQRRLPEYAICRPPLLTPCLLAPLCHSTQPHVRPVAPPWRATTARSVTCLTTSRGATSTTAHSATSAARCAAACCCRRCCRQVRCPAAAAAATLHGTAAAVPLLPDSLLPAVFPGILAALRLLWSCHFSATPATSCAAAARLHWVLAASGLGVGPSTFPAHPASPAWLRSSVFASHSYLTCACFSCLVPPAAGPWPGGRLLPLHVLQCVHVSGALQQAPLRYACCRCREITSLLFSVQVRARTWSCCSSRTAAVCCLLRAATQQEGAPWQHAPRGVLHNLIPCATVPLAPWSASSFCSHPPIPLPLRSGAEPVGQLPRVLRPPVRVQAPSQGAPCWPCDTHAVWRCNRG